jgi:hypothetical protein
MLLALEAVTNFPKEPTLFSKPAAPDFNPSRLAEQLRYGLTKTHREELVTFLKKSAPMLKTQTLREVARLNMSVSHRNCVRVLLYAMSNQALVQFFSQSPENETNIRERLFRECVKELDGPASEMLVENF